MTGGPLRRAQNFGGCSFHFQQFPRKLGHNDKNECILMEHWCVIMAMIYKRSNPKRRKWNLWGISLSSGYLMLTVILKGYTYLQFKEALESQTINYRDMNTRPAAFNAILWNTNIDTGDAYLLADYSLLDSQPISFQAYEKNQIQPLLTPVYFWV